MKDFKIRNVVKEDIYTIVAKKNKVSIIKARSIINYFETYFKEYIENDLSKPFAVPFIGKFTKSKVKKW